MLKILGCDLGKTWALLVLILCVLLLIYCKSWLRAALLAFTLPGPRALPVIGNALLVADSEKLQHFGNTAYQKFGPLFRTWLSIVPTFFIYDPNHLQIVLGSNKHSNKNWIYTLMHTFIGEGLITNNGTKWKVHRKSVQPFFQNNVLETFIPTYEACADKLIKNLEDKDEVNITKYVNECVLDVLHQAVLGLSPTEAENEKNCSPFRKGELLVPYRLTRPWLLLHTLFKLTSVSKNELSQKTNLQNYTRRVLKAKQKQAQTESEISTNKSLMDFLIEISQNNKSITEEDIINETTTFMLAGQDSVGGAIAFTLYHLAKHQEIQQKVVEELEIINPREVTIGNLNKMKYLEQCIKESLRLCPVVPMFARRSGEDVLLGKHVIPESSNLFVAPFITHRLPHIYPDPLKYDPDRFSDENVQKMHPYAFIPFSMGPRNCIGYKFAYLEMKTIISKILLKYHIELKSPTELNISYRITLRAKGGIWLRLRHRTIR